MPSEMAHVAGVAQPTQQRTQAVTHTVVRGDELRHIAARYGVSTSSATSAIRPSRTTEIECVLPSESCE